MAGGRREVSWKGLSHLLSVREKKAEVDPGFEIQQARWLVVPFTELQIASCVEGWWTHALSIWLCAPSGDT